MAKEKTAIGFVESLQDPDMVGASEYRAIHELLKDIAEGNEEEEGSLSHLDCVLSEVISHAKAIKSQLKKYRKGV